VFASVGTLDPSPSIVPYFHRKETCGFWYVLVPGLPPQAFAVAMGVGGVFIVIPS